MKPDDHICHCYHVSYRKLANYARREQPSRPSQMSECLGAGTGCGWCIPILKSIHASAVAGTINDDLEKMTPEEYAANRRDYIESDKPKNTF